MCSSDLLLTSMKMVAGDCWDDSKLPTVNVPVHFIDVSSLKEQRLEYSPLDRGVGSVGW